VKSLYLLLVWFFLALSATAQNAGSVFRIPNKPTNRVSDESLWLSAEERAAWEHQLNGWNRSEGVDLYLVILPSLHSTPAEYVIRQIADQWGKADLHGVVLYVPGSSGPSLWWNGEVMEKVQLDPRARREMIARMEKRASSQVTERDRIATAVQELSDTLRVISAQATQLQAMRDRWNDTVYQKWSNNRLSRRTMIIFACGVGLLSALLLFLILRSIFRRRKSFHFPRTSPQRRFGAAYAGGSGATSSIKS
jgi:uncharacterized membrane protein YgcG